jgi:dihydroneopterin aldolase
MDTITLSDMEFFAHHGCYEEERTTGTYFSVDLRVEADLCRPSASDCLHDAVNYQRLYDAVRREMQRPSNLLEHVAGRILQALHNDLHNIVSATVTIRKMNPPLGGKVGSAAVTMSRAFQ